MGLRRPSYSALTWVPAGCTATALNVFSEQGNAITVTLRSGRPLRAWRTQTLACSSATTGDSCSASGSITVPAGNFVDLSISGARQHPGRRLDRAHLQLNLPETISQFRSAASDHCIHSAEC